MNLSDYFDPYNRDHLSAWRHLCEHHMWTHEFWAEVEANSLTIDNGWQFVIVDKIAEAWVKHMLEE